MSHRRIALVDFSAGTSFRDALAREGEARGWNRSVCEAATPRERLRWILDLDPAPGLICLFIDPDGTAAGGALEGLDPAIPALLWIPAGAGKSVPALGSAGDRLLISCAGSAAELCDTLELWGATAGGSALGHDARAEELQTRSGEERLAEDSVEDTPQAIAPEKPGFRDEEWQDLQMLRELEQSMAVAHAGLAAPNREPVPVQPAALDFSVPLRSLMTAAGRIAEAAGSAEVTGAYAILALLQEKQLYGRALATAGLDQIAFDDAAKSARVGELAPQAEPVMSQEVFDAVGRGKEIARTIHAPVVRVYDFLLALLEGPAASVEKLLASRGADPARVLEAIISAGPEEEAAPDPFFRPSSLDQAGFYEFDGEQLQSFVDRLKDRPSFKKAAKRLPEARRRQGEEAAPVEEKRTSPMPAVMPSTAPEPPEKPEILRVSGEFPSVDEVEQAADLLLEGHLVAFPADTMLALAADATNPAAVEALRLAAGLPDEKPVGLWINSTAQLKHLVRADLEALEGLLEDAWPGALTLVFEATPAVGLQVQQQGSIAIRQPMDTLSLAILSMLGRPLAVTSWDQDVAGLAGKVAAIFDHGHAAPAIITTVLDLRTAPWTVLREGAVVSENLLRHGPPGGGG